MKTISTFLVGILAVFVFSGVVHAGNTAGVFRLPYDPNQQWPSPCASSTMGFWNDPPNHGQNFMNLNTALTVPKYHLAEDWNGKCGGSTDRGAVLYAIADGVVETATMGGSPTSKDNGGWLLIRHPLPDGTPRYILYEHIQSIETNPRTGAKFKTGDPVYIGDTIARLGDGNGAYPDAAHLHFEMRRSLFSKLDTNPYYQPLLVSDALKYSSPSLFIDDRANAIVQNLVSSQWTVFAQNANAPSSTAFVEYNGERYSLQRAVNTGLIYQYVQVQISGTWYYYPDITKVLFDAGNTYNVWSFVGGAKLNILVPGHNFKEDRVKIDMIRAVSANSNFKSVKPDIFKLYSSDSSFDYWYMQFTYNNGSGDQAVYANQATLKSNPLIRYTAYYDPATASWTAWTQVNTNTLD
jgi:hypothetical protein